MQPRQDKLLMGAPTGDATGAPTLESKLAAVKSYRRAMGLCYRCAGKWSKDHKCPPEILLAVANIWESAELSESPPLSLEDESPPEQLFLALSKAAVGSSHSVHTMQFEGSVAGQPILILLDSGSSVSFISKSVAAKFPGAHRSPVSSNVKVAGGGILTSEGILCQLPWMIGQCTFKSDFRILDLQSFDVIVGMDWLSAFSPMHIH
jgi:hypothetical protein